MHSANPISLRFVASLIGGGPVPRPSGSQSFSAFSNAGPLKAMPAIVIVELPGVAETELPPSDRGSGKFWIPMGAHAASGGVLLAEASRLVRGGLRRTAGR